MLRLPTRNLPYKQVLVGIFMGVLTGSYIYNEPFKQYSQNRDSSDSSSKPVTNADK